MDDETSFLQAMQEHPEDNALRLVFADWLEERNDPRGELIRLLHTLTQSVEVPDRSKLEDRLRSLLASGVQPVGPFWTNSIGMKFAWIPAGTFLMGSPPDEEGRAEEEIQHKVTLTKGFYLAIHPVPQASWREVMGNNPSYFHGDSLPVEEVSWSDCREFLRKLSERDGYSYRLPTEAEWEYACRAGTTTPFSFGETVSPEQANYGELLDDDRGAGSGSYFTELELDQLFGELPGDSPYWLDRRKTTSVGSFPPNAWGLHDMHGNVWEWCANWYGEYPPGEILDPQGPQGGKCRQLRGGSFGHPALVVRSAQRNGREPTYRSLGIGLRPVMTFPEQIKTRTIP